MRYLEWQLNRERKMRSELASERAMQRSKRGDANVRIGTKRFEPLPLQAKGRTVLPSFYIQPIQQDRGAVPAPALLSSGAHMCLRVG